MSFESFSSHVKAQTQTKVTEEKTNAQKAVAAAFENLLKKFDVTSPAELTESQKESFVSELFNVKATGSKMNEAEIKTDDEFKEYVNTILNQQHTDDFDADKAK